MNEKRSKSSEKKNLQYRDRPGTGAGRESGDSIPAAAASTWYVTTGGSDGNSGSSGSPFLTIAHAISVAGSGDVINVGPGSYAESFSISSKTNLTIMGAVPLQLPLRLAPWSLPEWATSIRRTCWLQCLLIALLE